MVCFPLVADFVDIIPKVIWTIFGWGVDSEQVDLRGVGEGECEMQCVGVAICGGIRDFTTTGFFQKD